MYQLHVIYCVFFGTGDRGIGINEAVCMYVCMRQYIYGL